MNKVLGLLLIVGLLAVFISSGCGGGGGGTSSSGGTTGLTYPPGVLVGQVVSTLIDPVTGTNKPVVGAVVRFYDAGGQIVGTATTTVQGTYGVTPTGVATGIDIDPASLDTTKYDRVIGYRSKVYSLIIPGCRGPVPPYSPSRRTLLSLILVYDVSVVPPPPNCG